MSSFTRRFAGLPALAALASLVACGAPPGEDAANTSDEALTIVPRPIPPLAPVAPTYYSSQQNFTPNNAPLVKMQSSTTSVCLLQRVSGGFSSSNSFAKIFVSGGYYYLQTSGFTEASAACVPMSNFSGTGTQAIALTIASPYNYTIGHSQSSIGYDQATVPLWGKNAMCVLSGLGGDWTGRYTGARATAPILSTYITGSYSDVIETNGPGITMDADCFEFPARSAVTQTTVKANAYGSPNVLLPSQTVALCGLSAYTGTINGYDAAAIVQNGNGTQSLALTGNTSSASATCMLYQQQGS